MATPVGLAVLTVLMGARSPAWANDSGLFDAIRAGDVERVRTLLRSEADPDSRDPGGVPAVIRAVVYLPVEGVQLLLDRGADVDASSKSGATALIWSAADTAKTRLLLDRRANPNHRAQDGATALVAAARFGNVGAMRLLLARGADPTASGSGTLDLFRVAYSRNDRRVLQLLAQAGLTLRDPKEVPGTTLAALETPAVVKGLLRAGADPNEPVRIGTIALTPLASAAHAGTLDSLSALIDHGADPNARAARGLTPLTLAAAANRADAAPVLAGHATEVTLGQWRPQEEQLLSGATRAILFGFLSSTIYGLFALAEEGVPPSAVTDAVVLRIAAFQGEDGGWFVGPLSVRPPLDGSPITRAALAIRALSVYAPPGRRAEVHARIARARRFVERAAAVDTHGEVFKLLALIWSGAPKAAVLRQRQRVLALQRADGEGGQWPAMTSDAFATGQALYALQVSGVSPRSDHYRQGAAYLLRTQLEDGTWFVRSRAIGFQRYFETGFPHGRNQFISAAATSWAAIALAYTLP